MIRLVEKINQQLPADGTVTLPLEKRIKSRLRVTLGDCRDAGIFLPRGETLKHNDLLRSEDGEIIRVIAAAETVSTVLCDNGLLLARICYHLGNRHVPIQIRANTIHYLHDHVLDDMIRGFGLNVIVEQAPFQPEPGAYGDSADAEHKHADQHHSH